MHFHRPFAYHAALPALLRDSCKGKVSADWRRVEMLVAVYDVFGRGRFASTLESGAVLLVTARTVF